MNFLIGFVGLVGGFSVLIFVHELGHYLLAKWNGVRVQVFSLGMGPYLVSFKWGDTVYVLSMVPIGGYVKMTGQEDMNPDLSESKDPGDYRNKKPGQRAAILAAGAVFNLIFALVVFTGCYYQGVTMKGQAPIVGVVSPESPLGKAGEVVSRDGDTVPMPLRRGDRITKINGQSVKTMMEVALEVSGTGPGVEIEVDYERDGVPARSPVRVTTIYNPGMGASTIGVKPYLKEVKYAIGFSAQRALYVQEEPKAETAASAAGVKLGDKILEFDGVKVEKMSKFIKMVQDAEGREQETLLERDGKEQTVKLKARFNDKAKRYLVGLKMGSVSVVDAIGQDSEAYKAGLREGAFIHLKELRSGDKMEVSFANSFGDFLAEKITQIEIPMVTKSESTLVCVQRRREDVIIKTETFVAALALAWSDVVRYSKSVFFVVRGLLSGNVSTKAVSGPIGIGGIMTSVAVDSDIMFFLWFLAFLSIQLGVFQFIPIPLLDGFHLVLIAVEKLKGSPVSVKTQIACQWVGLSMILLLVLMATRNDIMRYMPG